VGDAQRKAVDSLAQSVLGDGGDIPEVIQVAAADDLGTKLYFDKQTGLLVRQTSLQ
jgi:hypothetical protein